MKQHQKSSPIKIMIVDDDASIRSGLKMRMDLEPDLDIIGEASNGLQALDRLKELSPDVILMDLEMPEMDGISAVRAIQATGCTVPIIILTIHDSPAERAQAVRAGAVGFVGKQEGLEALLKSIRQICRS